MTTKTTNIAYWIFTGLLSFVMIGSAIPDVMLNPIAVKGMHEELGYPLYFLPYLGTLKILGGIAILIPGYYRIKEWAYAGIMFDLVSAMVSIIAVGKPASQWAGMPLFMALAFASYFFYHKKYKIIA